jgi:hypothetical protein
VHGLTLLGLVVATQALDGLSYVLGYHTPGLMPNEVNGLANLLHAAGGPWTVLALKLGVAGAVVGALWLSRLHVRRPRLVLGLCLMGCAGALANLGTLLVAVTG